MALVLVGCRFVKRFALFLTPFLIMYINFGKTPKAKRLTLTEQTKNVCSLFNAVLCWAM